MNIVRSVWDFIAGVKLWQSVTTDITQILSISTKRKAANYDTTSSSHSLMKANIFHNFNPKHKVLCNLIMNE